MRKHKLKIALSLFLLTIFLVMYHNVPKKVSADDEASLTELFGSKRVVEEELSFEEQIAFIDRMVNILHDNYVVGISIPYYAPREPAQLIENGGGLCYDFSRTIEKYLMSNGFMTRHVAVYLDQGSFLNTITLRGAYSHSLTEVKTKKGWMIVDSNLKFYAIDEANEIYAFKDLVKLQSSPSWKLPLDKALSPFYSPKVRYVYGLYSRHGGFYKPYNFVPDYNFREIFYNL